MSILKRRPRYDVISIRMNPDRLALLERYRTKLSAQLGRAVSIAEAAFLALEDRTVEVDREATRSELLETPTTSLDRIRSRWTSHHTLAAAEWDVLAEYVRAGAQQSVLLRPRVPSRESYLALLDAFEAVYLHRKDAWSMQAWTYLWNLGRSSSDAPRPADTTDADQRQQIVLAQIEQARALVRPTEGWTHPGNVGDCLLVAIREEGVDATALDQILTPFWPRLWGLAARGHWIRQHEPVRTARGLGDDVRRLITLPDSMTAGALSMTCAPAGHELAMRVELGSPIRFGYWIKQYPELAEFRALLEDASDEMWFGRHFFSHVAKTGGITTHTLWLKQQEVRIDYTADEWNTMRDLLQRLWENPGVQLWIQELQQEYGEQG
jgi:hypothetical protein